MNISALLKAFKAGQELSNAATWKNRQTAINALTVLLTALVAVIQNFVPELKIPDDLVGSLATGGYGLVILLNIVFTTVTSKKVGVK